MPLLRSCGQTRKLVSLEKFVAEEELAVRVQPRFNCTSEQSGFRLCPERTETVKIFSGTSNPPLARSIAASIGTELGKCTVDSFPDGETFVKIEENVRGEDV